MAKLDQHLTTEQLSTLLDAQLAQADAESSGHLEACQQCQHELAGLQQTVNLLRALPQPALPRSFVLPTNILQTTTPATAAPATRMQAEPNIHTLRSTNDARRPAIARRSAGRRVLGLTGTLAAVVGILFVLSGFVTSMPTMTMSSGATSSTTSSASANRPESGGVASSASSSAGSAAGSVAQNNGTPAAQGVQPAQAPAYAHAQNTSSTQEAQHEQNSASSPSLPSLLSFLDVGAAGVRIGLGILLFIVGMMGVALGREWRKEVRS